MVEIFDGLFTYQERCDSLDFLKNSFYRVVGTDVEQDGSDFQIFSRWNADDYQKFPLVHTDGWKTIDEKYKISDQEFEQIRINFSNFSEKNRVHFDRSSLTILYYANLDWKLDWGGHTFFLSEDLSDIEKTVVYKPGRVVVFKGSLPHMIMAPSILAPMPRFSWAIQLKEKQI